MRVAETVEALAATTALPERAPSASIASLCKDGPDAFGRTSKAPPLRPSYCAVRVTGALFHTQGGLNVDHEARVLGRDGTPRPNLLAAGGAAVGVSGSGDSGYLSGNGLLSAVVLWRIAGHRAALDTMP